MAKSSAEETLQSNKIVLDQKTSKLLCLHLAQKNWKHLLVFVFVIYMFWNGSCQLFSECEVIVKQLKSTSLLVWALMSFNFNAFLKRFDMLRQCLVPSITKKVNSYSLVLGQQPLIALQIQNFHYSLLMNPTIYKTF